MRMSRWVIMLLWLVACGGCQKGMDWWNRHKAKPEPQQPKPALAQADNKVDEALLDEAMKGDPAVTGDVPEAGEPSTTAPSSQPKTRIEWKKKGRKQPTTAKKRPTLSGETIETPILKVNNDVITVREVLEPLRNEFEVAVKEMSLVEYNRFVTRELKTRVIRLIEEVLVYDEASKEITEEMEPAIVKAVDKTEMSRINAEFGGRFSRWEAYLQKTGQKRSDVRHLIRRGLVVRQYLKDTFLPLIEPATRRDLIKYYERNPDEFTKPLRVEMFLIDVPYWEFLEEAERAGGKATWSRLRGRRRIEAKRAAQEHMDKALQELASGISFDAVAKSYSFGPNRRKGGAWGPVSPGGLTGRWAEAANVLFELDEGRMSDVIKTEDGLLLVRAGKRFEARKIPFAEAQPIIEKKLVQEQQRKMEGDLVMKLRAKAHIGDVESFFIALYKAVPRHRDADKTTLGRAGTP